MATGGLFYSGTLNNGNTNDLSVDKPVQSLPQPNVNQMASEANAKSKVKKSGALSVSAKCSCSLYEDYRTHGPSWANYCPRCHAYNTVIFEKTGDCPEGMMRCTRCDADFCAVHGKEHINRHPTYLSSG